MPTQQQVLAAAGDQRDYVRAGRCLGIPAGQAYLIATGLPADGGDVFPPELAGPGVITGSTQHLVYDHQRVVNPTEKPEVDAWMQKRARADLR